MCPAMLVPFGLHSTPKIFSDMADVLQWCMRQQGASLIEHYLDDFIMLGPQIRTNAGLTYTLLRQHVLS